MNALQRLENGGFTFDLTPNGQIAYRCPADAPAEWINTRAATLLAEVAENQEEVMTVLRARREWIAVWDEWTERLSREPGNLDRDIAYRRRLMELAIAGRLPCYDGGQEDLGPEGWRKVTEQEIEAWIEQES